MRGLLYNLASIHHLTMCIVDFNCLQNVPTHGSEFTYRCAHSPVKFVFIDHNFCVGSGVRLFQALFCAYATVINKTPGLCFTECFLDYCWYSLLYCLYASVWPEQSTLMGNSWATAHSWQLGLGQMLAHGQLKLLQ